MSNKNLTNARISKNDEFYTQYKDIENELQHYTKHFKDKIVYCNCDTAESNFVKYFQDNFDALGLKDLLYSSNDFRSAESIELLKKCDIVVTNPPFSLFREYVAQLMDYDKKFIIVGNQNAITRTYFFKYLQDGKVWLGFGFKGNVGFFKSPYEDYAICSHRKEGFIRISGVKWFTNLDYEKRHEKLTLHKKYSPEEYPKYDNYDAININRTSHIPADYEGVMGVPITFLDKYNPKQFKIIGNEEMLKIPKGRGYVNGKKLYARIFIQKIK